MSQRPPTHPQSQSPSQHQSSRRLHPAIIVSIVLGVLLLVAIVSGAGGVAVVKAQSDKQQKRADALQQQVDQQGPGEQTRTDITTAAKADMTALLSYDYRTLDAYVDGIPKVTTDQFRTTFLQNETSLKPTQVAKHAVAKTEVKDAAVADATADTAHVLMFVDVTVTTTDSSSPTVQHYRVRLTVKHVGTGWLADSLVSS